jgi:hypothetical protein
MTKSTGIIRLILLGWTLWLLSLPHHASADTGAVGGFSEITLGADLAAYNTELFNLLSDHKNMIDGKNYYEKRFAASFDALLLKSHSTQSKQAAAQLKKRLLSGPAAKPRAFKDIITQKVYLYFDACQAHACDEVYLGLLYETQSKLMVARLASGGKEEFLGGASDPEKNLLRSLKPNVTR